MEPGLVWILAGLLLLLAELVLPGVFLLWVGLAAIGTGVLLLVATPGFGVAVLFFLGEGRTINITIPTGNNPHYS